MPRFLPCYSEVSRRVLWTVVLTLLLWPLTMNSQPQFPTFYFFPVPNTLLNTDGNTNSQLPFAVLGPVRYQQVYDASQFSQLPPGGAFLTRIFLRADCTSIRNWSATNLEVRVSTTSKGPDQLSPTFAANVGPDEIMVFSAARWAPPAICSLSFGDSNWMMLSVPFFYDPARGNLLVEVRHAGIDWAANPAPLYESSLDAQSVSGDSVSRAAAFSANADTAEVLDSVGLATAFEFRPTPTLYVRSETNNVILTWPTHPKTFCLQWSDAAASGAGWSDYSGPIEGGDLWQETVLPANSLSGRKFFRLFWNTPQPLPTAPVSPAVQVDPVIKP